MFVTIWLFGFEATWLLGVQESLLWCRAGPSPLCSLKMSPPLLFKKSWPRHPQTPSFSLTPLKPHMAEVYKGFHSTSPNFTLPSEIACVCVRWKPPQCRGGLSDCLVPVRGCLLCLPLWTGLKLRCNVFEVSLLPLPVLCWCKLTPPRVKTGWTVCSFAIVPSLKKREENSNSVCKVILRCFYYC